MVGLSNGGRKNGVLGKLVSTSKKHTDKIAKLNKKREPKNGGATSAAQNGNAAAPAAGQAGPANIPDEFKDQMRYYNANSMYDD